MARIETYTGGFFQTNAYALETPAGKRILIDAPEGSADWLRAHGWTLDALLLTHAHIDHIHDAAAIVREHKCPAYYHPDGLPLLRDRHAYRRYGLSIDFEPVEVGELIGETRRAEFAGQAFEILFVPGHCPGSLCFYDAERAELFGGDVLFAGSIGRTDLPGGDHELLLRGIREKVLPLPGGVDGVPRPRPRDDRGRGKRTQPVSDVTRA